MDMWKDADRLVIEYKEGLKDLKLERELIKINDEHSDDLRLLGGMISDMEHAIEWLETAREPGTRRTISNRSRYQRTSLWGDIEHLSLMVYEEQQRLEPISNDQLNELDAALAKLPASERAVFVAVVGKGLSHSEAADYLGIQKDTLKTYLKRAKKKIEKMQDKGYQLQLIDF
ncbi:MAG: sigma-70 family RNA polymerase sigma factor [Carnobacterium sp.]